MDGLALILFCVRLLVWITVSLSAYSQAGITASGQHTRPGLVACGESYPFGTQFLIDGQVFTCADRGRLVTDRHIDIFMPDVDAAWEFGRHEARVGLVQGVRCESTEE